MLYIYSSTAKGWWEGGNLFFPPFKNKRTLHDKLLLLLWHIPRCYLNSERPRHINAWNLSLLFWKRIARSSRAQRTEIITSLTLPALLRKSVDSAHWLGCSPSLPSHLRAEGFTSLFGVDQFLCLLGKEEGMLISQLSKSFKAPRWPASRGGGGRIWFRSYFNANPLTDLQFRKQWVISTLSHPCNDFHLCTPPFSPLAPSPNMLWRIEKTPRTDWGNICRKIPIPPT